MKRILRDDRTIIRITGDDSRPFLQGLISNDIARADGEGGLYAALLTPQGKFLFDFFIVADGAGLLMDIRKDDAAALIKKLTMFKLRSKVALEDLNDTLAVYVLFGDGAPRVLGDDGRQTTTADGVLLYADPRQPDAGVRAIVPPNADVAALGGTPATEDDYQRHRIALGLPEAPLDLQPDKSILLESGFDELAGVDWKKGCYMGQELTARTKYRGLIKKRLVPVKLNGTATSGTDIMQDGKLVGDLRSVSGDLGMAMLRLAAIDSAAVLHAGDATLTPAPPAWFHLPESDDAGA